MVVQISAVPAVSFVSSMHVLLLWWLCFPSSIYKVLNVWADRSGCYDFCSNTIPVHNIRHCQQLTTTKTESATGSMVHSNVFNSRGSCRSQLLPVSSYIPIHSNRPTKMKRNAQRTLSIRSHQRPYRIRYQPSPPLPPYVDSLVSLSALSGPSSSISNKLTPLPSGLSPFDKSISKMYDVQGSFRTIAFNAIQKAIAAANDNENMNKKVFEIEIPPLVSNGIDVSKNQFDDFDNVQELNANRNWCIQLIPKLLQSPSSTKTDVVWFILPDDKECEIAKTEYVEQLRYQSTDTILFTSIRAAFVATSATVTATATATATATGGAYKKAWGTSIAETINKLQGGDGILADSSTLDSLDDSDVVSNKNNKQRRRIQLICQPGNGGPVEDWINVEQFYYNTVRDSSTGSTVTATIIVNGALDKVRDGYYPAIFFSALAKTIPFYKNYCEPILFVKPISDKGLYGWMFRVYPEPWQIILQLPRRQKQSSSNYDNDTIVVVDDVVVLVSDARPSYQEAVDAMVREAQKRQQQQQM